MRILLITLEYPPFKGGVANYYYNLVENWSKEDKIFVLHNNNGLLLSDKLWPKWFLAFFALYKNLKNNNIEHVMVGHILPLGTVTFLLSKIFKFQYSVFLHGMDLEYALKKIQKKYLTKIILKNAKTIISTNSYVEKQMLKFLGDEFDNKSFVVNPGVTIYRPKFKIQNSVKVFSEFRERYSLDGKFILFSLGRLVKRKGQDKVIEAVQKLKKSIPNLYYYIAGEGKDEKYLKDFAKDNSHIEFLGMISDDEKDLWLKNCDIFIMPSRNINGDLEGFGIVYLEAALAGKAVIAGKSGGVGDAVIDYETGLLVDSNNIDSIQDAILELYSNFDLRQELGNNGLKRSIASFNWKGQAEKILKAIKN